MANDWTPTSWQQRPIAQGVTYPDCLVLKEVLDRWAMLPPLTTSWEILKLKQHVAEASRGRRFILQGGDCSERFADCRADIITNKLKILLKMSLILCYASKKPLTRVGRIAGQYAKPRSSQEETRDGVTYHSYRGDLINRFPFTKEDRTPNPWRMLRGYERSALTLNFIRSLVEGGFADFRHPEFWDLRFTEDGEERSDKYQDMLGAVTDSIRFTESVTGSHLSELSRVEFFVSHEGLLLDYEQAHSHQVPRRKGWFNLSTHMPWIGDRPRQIDGAHVEYFRGIENPIGVKVGPTTTEQMLVELCETLNPCNEPGRLTLITRFGVDRVEDHLPSLIEAVQRAGKKVLWCSDPMHGNTRTTESGIKTRSFADILGELNRSFEIHTRLGTILGGVHFELTGENVTECTGGAANLQESDLLERYESDVDPRLNYEQALEMALLIGRRMQENQPR